MTDLRYTLLADGSSDRALLPVISWSLRQCGVRLPIRPEWADLGLLRRPPDSLSDRIRAAMDLYPCELLFVHRDSETESVDVRRREIRAALDEVAGKTGTETPAVCIVPRRMTEAWLLISEPAIRAASGNPSGRVRVELPRLDQLEEIPDPKEVLFAALRGASELRGRKLRRLRVHQLVHRTVELIEDFSPLRTLAAFGAFEADLQRVLVESLRVVPGVVEPLE